MFLNSREETLKSNKPFQMSFWKKMFVCLSAWLFWKCRRTRLRSNDLVFFYRSLWLKNFSAKFSQIGHTIPRLTMKFLKKEKRIFNPERGKTNVNILSEITADKNNPNSYLRWAGAVMRILFAIRERVTDWQTDGVTDWARRNVRRQRNE